MNLLIRRNILVVVILLTSACQHMQTQEAERHSEGDQQSVTSEERAPALPTDQSCECPSHDASTDAPPATNATTPDPITGTTACPEPAPLSSTPTQAQAQALDKELQLIGRVEYAFLKLGGSADNTLRLKARIDTGAGLTSLHAHDLQVFERDSKPWVRFALIDPKTKQPVYLEKRIKRHIDIKQLGDETQRRPVVRVSLTIGDIRENLEVTLTDRSGYVYQVLIGRNFLRDRAIVDVSQKFIADDKVFFR